MTYIEFFDKNASENICASLSRMPERIILVGDKRRQMLKSVEFYREVFAGRGLSTEFICKSVNKNQLQNIVEVLCRIVEEYPDCVFDATGGDDLFLVALGVVWERYQGKNVMLQRFNLYNNTIQDCDADGKAVLREMPSLSVEENIRIYGGRVVYESEVPLGTHVWSMDAEFEADIQNMWNICRVDTRQWNQQISVLAAAERCREPGSARLTTEVSVPKLLDALNKPDLDSILDTGILSGLIRAGLIEDFQQDADFLRITYKDSQIKRCLTKAGLALEMKMYLTAKNAVDRNGIPVYNDVMTGVSIDWDGELFDPPKGNGPQNEIDVIAMRGMVPVFISCKNGFVEADELYKLYTVAENFGGKYVKKVLVVNGLEEGSAYTLQLRQRAEEMGIRMVTDFPEMSDGEQLRVVRSFWSN